MPTIAAEAGPLLRAGQSMWLDLGIGWQGGEWQTLAPASISRKRSGSTMVILLECIRGKKGWGGRMDLVVIESRLSIYSRDSD